MKSKFSLTQYKDDSIMRLVNKTDKRVLALWAIDCAKRVMPYFKKECSDDDRPRKALNVLKKWLRTSEFKMNEIRKASLDAHAAASQAGGGPAHSAARAAGQAVATAHVKTHSIGAAIYALQAIHKATNSTEAVAKEKEWQEKRLKQIIDSELVVMKQKKSIVITQKEHDEWHKKHPEYDTKDDEEHEKCHKKYNIIVKKS